MKCRLFANGLEVGTAELSPTDPSMGVVGGEFAPNDNYAAVQAVIREPLMHDGTFGPHDPDRLARAYVALDSLGLYVLTDSGLRLEPAGPTWLSDFSLELEPPNIELNVCGLHWEVLRDVFGHDFDY